MAEDDTATVEKNDAEFEKGNPPCTRIFKGDDGHEDQVISCTVSGDGNFLYTGSLDRKIKVWNISKGNNETLPVQTISGHMRGIRCVHAEGANLFSGAGDSFAKLWDTSTYKCKQTYVGHAAQVMAVKSAKTKLFTGSFDKTARLWDVETAKCEATFKGHEEGLASIALHDDNLLFTSSADSTVKMYDIRMKSEDAVRSFRGHTKVVTNVVICNGRLYSGSLDRSVSEWNIDDGTKIRDIIAPMGVDATNVASGPITSMAVATKNGKHLLYTAASNYASTNATGTESGVVTEWDVAGGEKAEATRTFSIGASIPWSVYAASDKLIVTCDDKSSKLWELKDVDAIASNTTARDCTTSCGSEGDGGCCMC